MPHSNLTMHQLSRYLHLPESQIRKLVDRGAIPSRRVNGELVFSRDEVHRWLETRIGASDDAELAQVEGALDRSVPAGEVEENVRISAMIPEEAVAVPLSAKTRDSAIRSMVQLGVATGLLWDGDAMAEAVKSREELHSTALDNGVALLHPRRPLPTILGESFIALGILPRGIPFGGGFDNLTDVFFLICSTDDRIHLRALARLSRILSTPGFLDKLREASDAAEVRDLIRDTEEKIV